MTQLFAEPWQSWCSQLLACSFVSFTVAGVWGGYCTFRDLSRAEELLCFHYICFTWNKIKMVYREMMSLVRPCYSLYCIVILSFIAFLWLCCIFTTPLIRRNSTLVLPSGRACTVFIFPWNPPWARHAHNVVLNEYNGHSRFSPPLTVVAAHKCCHLRLGSFFIFTGRRKS